MTIKEYKQLDKLTCEELNVKNFARNICNSEKGEISINFSLDDSTYSWLVSGELQPMEESTAKNLLAQLDK